MFIHAITIFLAMLPLCLYASAEEAEKLEKQMWENIKEQNWDEVLLRIATGFQSVHPDGARNRNQEIALIENLDIGNYTITDFKTTETPNSMIVTYKIAVPETIDKVHLPKEPSPRLSVWQNINGKWQWISHANLAPISGR